MARQFPRPPPPPELRSSPSLPPPTANLLGVFDSIFDMHFWHTEASGRGLHGGIWFFLLGFTTLARAGLFFTSDYLQ